MRARLFVEPHDVAIERARADVAAVPLFSSERPLREAAGRADWRLCGQLSRLLDEGRLSGEPGEAALIPTFGGLRTPLLLGLGLGPRAEFGPERCAAFAADAVDRSLRLGARTAALALPEARGLLRERVEALVAGAVRALPPATAPLRLLVVAHADEAERLASVLRSLAAEILPAGVVLAPAPGAPTPAGGRHPSAPSVSPVK